MPLATKTRRTGLRLIEGSITAWFAMVRQAKCPTHKGEKEKKIAPRHPGEKSRLISGDWGLGRRGRQIELDSVGLRVTNFT
jgi:hypothetical protein